MNMTVYVPHNSSDMYSSLRAPMFANSEEAHKWIEALPYGNAFWTVDSETVWASNDEYRAYWAAR